MDSGYDIMQARKGSSELTSMSHPKLPTLSMDLAAVTGFAKFVYRYLIWAGKIIISLLVPFVGFVWNGFLAIQPNFQIRCFISSLDHFCMRVLVSRNFLSNNPANGTSTIALWTGSEEMSLVPLSTAWSIKIPSWSRRCSGHKSTNTKRNYTKCLVCTESTIIAIPQILLHRLPSTHPVILMMRFTNSQSRSCGKPSTYLRRSLGERSQQNVQRKTFYVYTNTYNSGRIPVLLVPGTGSYGGEAFEPNFAKLLTASSFGDPVWLNVPGRMNDISHRNAEYVAYAISYMSTMCAR